jgi:hypothetical protein
MVEIAPQTKQSQVHSTAAGLVNHRCSNGAWSNSYNRLRERFLTHADAVRHSFKNATKAAQISTCRGSVPRT